VFAARPLSHCRLHAVTLAVTVALGSCGGSGGGNAPSAAPALTAPPRAIEQSDLQIAQTLYAGTPRTPPGFYQDPDLADTNVATRHLKNTDVDALATAAHPQ
jgi:hypothetical protein